MRVDFTLLTASVRSETKSLLFITNAYILNNNWDIKSDDGVRDQQHFCSESYRVTTQIQIIMLMK